MSWGQMGGAHTGMPWYNGTIGLHLPYKLHTPLAIQIAYVLNHTTRTLLRVLVQWPLQRTPHYAPLTTQ